MTSENKAGSENDGKTLTNEEMNKIRQIREETCIHGCYYGDTSFECIPPEENGIPNCKREIELILKALKTRTESEAWKGPWSISKNMFREKLRDSENRMKELRAKVIEMGSAGGDPKWVWRGEVVALIDRLAPAPATTTEEEMA